MIQLHLVFLLLTFQAGLQLVRIKSRQLQYMYKIGTIQIKTPFSCVFLWIFPPTQQLPWKEERKWEDSPQSVLGSENPAPWIMLDCALAQISLKWSSARTTQSAPCQRKAKTGAVPDEVCKKPFGLFSKVKHAALNSDCPGPANHVLMHEYCFQEQQLIEVLWGHHRVRWESQSPWVRN